MLFDADRFEFGGTDLDPLFVFRVINRTANNQSFTCCRIVDATQLPLPFEFEPSPPPGNGWMAVAKSVQKLYEVCGYRRFSSAGVWARLVLHPRLLLSLFRCYGVLTS